MKKEEQKKKKRQSNLWKIQRKKKEKAIGDYQVWQGKCAKHKKFIQNVQIDKVNLKANLKAKKTAEMLPRPGNNYVRLLTTFHYRFSFLLM